MIQEHFWAREFSQDLCFVCELSVRISKYLMDISKWFSYTSALGC